MFRRRMIRIKSEFLEFQKQRPCVRVMGATIRAVLLWVLFCQGLAFGQLAAQNYHDPDFEVVLFNQDALSLEGNDRATVVEALAALASNFPQNGLVGMDIREKALALALRLDALSASARAARQALLSGQATEATGYFEKLPSISKVLWDQAVAMKKSQEPEDAYLIPLLMELALVIYPSAPPMSAVVFLETMTASGAKSPDWKAVVALSEGEGSSYARAMKVLQHGRKLQKKIAKGLAAKEQVAMAAVVMPKDVVDPMPVKGKIPKAAEPGSEGLDILASTEVNVVVWKRSARGPSVLRSGKVRLNVRAPNAEDASLFENGSGAAPENMAMRFRKKILAEKMPWLSFMYGVMRPRHPEWPRGKVAEVDFAFSGRDRDLGEARLVEKTLATGVSLALESALTGVSIDPRVLVYGRLENDGRFVNQDGDLIEVRTVAAEGGYQVIAVAPEVETQLRDWTALGELERLIRPQMVASSNMDELMAVIGSERSAETEEALQLFSEIENLTSKMSLQEAAKNAVVQQRLQAIVEQYPQHLSAKMLLAYGKADGLLKTSLEGSVKAVNDALAPLKERYDTAMGGGGAIGEVDELESEVKDRLRDMRSRVDDEAKELLNMSDDMVEALTDFLALKNKTSSTGMQKRETVEKALTAFNAEYHRLREVIGSER